MENNIFGHECEYSNFEAQKACFPGLQIVRPDRRTFGKFTESMPIWYLKRPKNCEDRRTGPGIFFGGMELPKKPLERKTSKSAGHGGGARPPAGFSLYIQPRFVIFRHSVCVDGRSLLPYAPCGSFTAFLHLV